MPVSEAAFEALKDRVVEVEQMQAVKAATDQNVVDRLAKIETILSRLTWAIILGIVGAGVTFIINGGLAHVAIG